MHRRLAAVLLALGLLGPLFAVAGAPAAAACSLSSPWCAPGWYYPTDPVILVDGTGNLSVCDSYCQPAALVTFFGSRWLCTPYSGCRPAVVVRVGGGRQSVCLNPGPCSRAYKP